MGKSSSGKDTIYKMLLEREDMSLQTIIPYTTRPLRAGEQEGVEYHFTTEEQLQKLLEENRVIEIRSYHTVHGIWKYFTVNDGQVELEKSNYLVIGTLESCRKLREYYGKEWVLPIYIEVDDGIRLQRALDRERMQTEPRYTEMCRRFISDAEDFSEEKMKEADIEKRFQNEKLGKTVMDIAAYIKDSSR